MYLEHNSRKTIYRNPYGAVTVNTRICLRVLVGSISIPQRVECIVGETLVKMDYREEINGQRLYECTIEAPEKSGVIFYCFKVTADGMVLYCGNNKRQLGGQSETYDYTPENRFQITVYEKEFKTPEWMKDAVIYQIFPDRFFRSGDTPFHGIKREWGSTPFYKKEQFGGEYLSNDFFGGTLCGIEEKLDYIKDLGVTAIYLNPIFKAFSNHRYDTSDYENVDETLGTNEDFERLCQKAHKMGIRVILDGVFSHTGADSKYFNKFGNFNSLGAYQSKESPYFSWYSFGSYPEKYDSWWGFDTLPNVREFDENYIDYIIENKNSIIKKWIRLGADGWRLDVADELPDEFIERLRKALKEEKEDALLIGEVWEDASNKISYSERRKFFYGRELDGVMNYVTRRAVLEFLTGGDAVLFNERLGSLMENYPKEALFASMNLISSHDEARAMTVLSGAPDFRGMTREEQNSYVISPENLSLAKRRMRLAIALQMTLPGAPMIYYGDEIGMTGFADPFNRAAFNWESTENELKDHTAFFAHLRSDNPSLRRGEFTPICYYGGVFGYLRSIENGKDIFGNDCSDGSVMVIVNSSDKYENIKLCLDRFGAVSATDVETGQRIMHNDSFEFEMAPISYRVLSLERNSNKCTKIQLTQ